MRSGSQISSQSLHSQIICSMRVSHHQAMPARRLHAALRCDLILQDKSCTQVFPLSLTPDALQEQSAHICLIGSEPFDANGSPLSFCENCADRLDQSADLWKTTLLGSLTDFGDVCL